MKSCWSDSLTPEPVFLTQETVLRIHDTLIERFGGASGLRDAGLLAGRAAGELRRAVFELEPSRDGR